MKKILIVALSTLTLTACKIDVETKVPLSGLLSEGIKQGVAELLVEVPACADHNDSRNPSEILIKAKDAVAKMLPVAEYKECFRREFNSFAQFSIPANYGRGSDGEWEKTQSLRIMALDDANGTHSIVVSLPKDVRGNLVKSSKDKLNINAFKPENVRIFINIENDLGKDYKAIAAATFVANSPVIFKEITIAKGKKLNFRLSDASTQVMLQTDRSENPSFLFSLAPK